MPIFVTCPHCRQDLQVPETLLGHTVECPDCSKAFQAVPADAPQAVASGPPPPVNAPTLEPPEVAEEGDEFAAPIDDGNQAPDLPKKKRRTRDARGGYFGELRRFQKRRELPHRGATVLILGIFSVMCSFGGFLALGAAACGYYAYQMGSHDLSEMQAGRMDPSGKGLVTVGRILGIVGVVISFPVVVLTMCAFGFAAFKAIAG